MERKKQLICLAKKLRIAYDKKWGHLDITMPMSDEELRDKKQIAAVWSEVNQIVRDKRF